VENFDSVIKRQYSMSGPSTEGYSILVPGLPNNARLGIRRGRMNVKAADLKVVFEPVVEKVIELVKGQIQSSKKKIKAVLLVGGFGQNNYLKERLRSAIGPSVEVKQPANAWTAVVRGAVMMGLGRVTSSQMVQLTSRVARRHYGMELRTKFDSRKHSENEKIWVEKNREYRTWAMHWIIKK